MASFFQNREINHIAKGIQTFNNVFLGNQRLWRSVTPPQITHFSVSPTRVDLDQRPTGNLRFSIGVVGQADLITEARTYLEPQNTQVGNTYTSPAGQGISVIETSIAQPNQNQNYRLLASNATGSSHQDISVEVVKGLLISNFRRTRFEQNQGTPGGFYTFSFRITGYPMPTTFVFSGVHSFTTDSRHLTPVPNQPNFWDFEIRFNLGVTSGSLTIVATNGTGDSATATIQDIGA